MKISTPDVIFFSIILITGGLTIFTDLKNKKIYNQHLGLGAALGLAAIIYTAVWAHENILFHMINGLIALVIGFCFYRLDLWRGGDAKLFTLYAFLMPALERTHILLSGAINLFACSFIIGTIILIPFFIKDIASNYNAVINKLLSKEKCIFLVTATGRTIFISWAIFPVYHFTKILHFPAISLAVTYLIFYLARPFPVKKKQNNIRVDSPLANQNNSSDEESLKKSAQRAAWIRLRITLFSILITFGFLMRLWLSPDSLSCSVLLSSIFRIGLFSALSACIYATLDLLNEYRNRVAFAPLLLGGCVLSYTPFLTWIMHLLRR